MIFENMWPLLESQVRMQYRLLNHTGYYSRVRCSNEKEEKYLCGIEEILDWARPRSGHGNLYISRNPFTKDGEVAGISGFTIDIDPIREPKDRASTLRELRTCINTATRIVRYCNNLCSKTDSLRQVLCTSGNGVLLLFPFNELVQEDIDGFTAKVQQMERVFKDQFSNAEVRIDATNYAKAILRLMGSPNVKDNDSRKWRYAKFLTGHSRALVRAKQSRIRDAIERIMLPQSDNLSELRSEAVSSDSGSVAGPGMALCDETKGLGPAARLALAEKSLWRLGRNRVENYDDWLKCGIALKEFGPVGFKLWCDWSRQSGKYDAGICRNKWNSFRTDQKLTVGTIKYWADQDDPPQQRARTLLSGVCGLGEDKTKLWTPGQPVSHNRGGSENGFAISTGFKWLDSKLNGGYRPGVVYAVEACTNVGKSQFVIQTAEWCCKAGRKVLLVTTEASIEEVCQRYFACGTGIPCSEIYAGGFSEDRRRALELYEASFRTTHRLGIWYTVSPKTEEIDKQINEFKPDIVLWDYFQHFETGTESRQIQLGSLARWFESTAIKQSIPIVVAAQLHERFDFKNRKRLPAIKDDIKECRTLNDTAKTVIVLDWDSKEQQTEDGPAVVRLSLDKNKGPIGETKLLLERRIPRFIEI